MWVTPPKKSAASSCLSALGKKQKNKKQLPTMIDSLSNQLGKNKNHTHFSTWKAGVIPGFPPNKNIYHFARHLTPAERRLRRLRRPRGRLHGGSQMGQHLLQAPTDQQQMQDVLRTCFRTRTPGHTDSFPKSCDPEKKKKNKNRPGPSKFQLKHG